MFVEMGAWSYGCVTTKAPRTAITSAKLLFLPPGALPAGWLLLPAPRKHAPVRLLLLRAYGDEEDAVLSGLLWEGESGCASAPVSAGAASGMLWWVRCSQPLRLPGAGHAEGFRGSSSASNTCMILVSSCFACAERNRVSAKVPLGCKARLLLRVSFAMRG